MSDNPHEYCITQAVGQLHTPKLGFDKHGRPFIDLKVTLTHVDDFPLLFQQSQALEVCISFETKTSLVPLFPNTAAAESYVDAIAEGLRERGYDTRVEAGKVVVTEKADA